jgi:guanosine-3',5'-bis(diphosphate) 3'-pyrophosphohydrolase
MNNKEQFLKTVMDHLPDIKEKDLGLISKAYDFAEKAHEGQVRANGKNYFEYHCVPVAINVLELGMNQTLTCAALLHDTIEDTQISAEDIKAEFGEDIAFLVEGVSKLGTIKYRGNERHVESLRKFFVFMAHDLRIVILKLADRWHNLETLEFLPGPKQQRIAVESIMIYAPLASRMGMGKLVGIIDDLAFPYAYPEEYKRTKKIIDSLVKNANDTVKKMHRDLSLDLYNSLKYLPKIDERIKGTYSLYKKLLRKKWNTDEIYDLIAIRTIVKSIPDCYQALGVIHQHWKPVPGRIKDYIAVPKPNGYQSLHTAVFSGDGRIIEIQVRTDEMHEFNEYGLASHHNYKNSYMQRGTDKESFAWIEQLRELQESNLTTSDYYTHLETDLFQDRIFVFTPKGDVVDLPFNATILDFAYAVHTKVGEHAGGGRINGKYMALKTPLQNEQIIEIVTNSKARPSDKWLEMCITNTALSNIRKTLKNQRGNIFKS